MSNKTNPGNDKEVWLRGPVAGIPGLLQPVAHALMQVREEIRLLMNDFDDEYLWKNVGGLASAGFHLQHISGVLDRLFMYAKGCQLEPQQLRYLENEGKPAALTSVALVQAVNVQVEQALHQLQQADPESLLQARDVGRSRLPSTVLGLYVHAAEHTMRHLGQLLVTVKVLPLVEKKPA